MLKCYRMPKRTRVGVQEALFTTEPQLRATQRLEFKGPPEGTASRRKYLNNSKNNASKKIP